MERQHKARMARKVLYSSLISAGMLAVMPGAAWATPVASPSFCDLGINGNGYDNSTPQTDGAWTDLRHGEQINSVDDPDSANSTDCMLELTGATGSAGDMWITMLDPPAFPAPVLSCVTINAEVRIKKFDNRKAVGFITNYDPATGKGLFLGLYDNGNTDALTLSTFEATASTAGKLTSTVVTRPLGALIKENTWYTLSLQNLCVSGTGVTGTAVVDGANLQPAEVMPINASLLPVTGIPSAGQIGIGGQAKSSFVDSTVRKFTWILSPD